MKIHKIAQVPNGFVILETRIDLSKGEVKSSFIREGKSQCKAEDGDFLSDILATQIPGFGPDMPVDAGKTAEYFEQIRPQVTPPVATKPEEESFSPVKQPQRRLDQGYGV